MNETKKNVFRTLSIVLTLALVISLTTSLLQQSNTADAEGVTLSQNATVVTSPFTEAVQKVHGSVVGVNNYTMSYGNYSNFGFPFDFGFGYGYGYGYGNGRESEPEEVLTGSGSGVVVAQGYVLTNYHVVEDASRLEIVSGEETYEAVVAGSDESLDLAVLKVENLPIQPVVLGDSDVLNVGDWAICIGNPLSFTGTTTVGVISALNREITNSTTDIYGRRIDSVNLMIQTDAAINAGNSGGGMFNVAGELIGVPSMKYTGSYMSATSVEGIGMAIPINVAKPLIEDVLSGKTNDAQADNGNSNSGSLTTANKPRIGVTVSNLDNVMVEGLNTSLSVVANGQLPNGAYIIEVEAGSPAEKAGLQAGDIVVEVDGTIIRKTTEMINILQNKQAGDTAAMKVYRVEGLPEMETFEDIPEGEYLDFTVELAVLDSVAQ